MMFVIIVTAIIDTSITRISIFRGELFSQIQNIVLFIIMIIVYAIGQYVILGYIASRRKDLTQPGLMFIHKAIRVIQCLLIVLLVSIGLEMIFTSAYSSFLLKLIVWINYALSAVLLGFLAVRFFAWYKSNRNNVVISYCIAMATLSALAIVTILYVSNELSGQRSFEFIRPNINYLTILGNTVVNAFTLLFVSISIVSFIATWFSTILLLRHYSKKLGRTRYWIIVSLPLVFFLSQFQAEILQLFIQLRLSDPFLFGIVSTLIFNSTKTIGGVLFGIAFWSIAKNLTRREVSEYMTISAYGMVLLFTSNQPLGLTFLPYPPFGLATVSFLGLASYLILVGFYSSALSVANDVEVRRYIKRSVVQEASLLSNIGTAQMEDQIRKMVLSKTKHLSDKITQETGIQPSLEDQEIKDYVTMAINEVKQARIAGKEYNSSFPPSTLHFYKSKLIIKVNLKFQPQNLLEAPRFKTALEYRDRFTFGMKN